MTISKFTPVAFEEAATGKIAPLNTPDTEEIIDESVYFSDRHLIRSVTDHSSSETSSSDVEQPRSILKELLKQVRVGQDLSRITLPTFILEPRSMLEKLTDCQTHPYLLSGVRLMRHPLDRIVAIARWYVSGFHTRPQGVKKPYNPLLGEVFKANWEFPGLSSSPSTIEFIAEQVSHHPPVSAFLMTAPQDGYSISCSLKAKSQFYGTSAAAVMLGQGTLSLHGVEGSLTSEDYHVTFPKYVSRNILVGTLYMELNGECSVECPHSHLYVQFDFKKRGLFGGSCNMGQLEGNVIIRPPIDATGKQLKDVIIGKIEGNWMNELSLTWFVTNPFTTYNEIVNFERNNVVAYQSLIKQLTSTINKSKQSVTEPFFSVAHFPAIDKIVKPIKDQNQWESRRLWRKVTEQLLQDKPDGASIYKSELEDSQRSRRRQAEALLTANNQALDESNWYKPKLFEKSGQVVGDGVYVYSAKKDLLEGIEPGELVDCSGLDVASLSGFDHVDPEWVKMFREVRKSLT
ncbi:hypothetical protein RCL1_002810 [Eukaryota sp. TZLM3-RCL]